MRRFLRIWRKELSRPGYIARLFNRFDGWCRERRYL